ncbi:putative membrane protein YphA (DoxX/SURF4 family) [Planomicrobium sp. HSC-17F08]|nr:putative membrane protein YphA (DoxX/SURF4 family) [Planomicrobium sp. HSC-17F08]
MAKHIKGLVWLVLLLMLAGLILIFTSVHFGIARGNSWLMRQMEGSDSEIYYMVIETYTASFMMIGGILFGTGLLIGVLTFFTSVLFDEAEESSRTELHLKQGEDA